jgi:NADH-quinone oxidoreductase subunit N
MQLTGSLSIGWVDFLLVSPALALLLGSVIPLAIKVLRGNEEQNAFATLLYGYMGLIVAAGLLVAGYGMKQTAFEGAVVFDGISSVAGLIVILMTAIALTFARDNFATNTHQFSEFVFLMMNAAIGMLVFIWANDLIVMFIGLELMSLCLYVLIAMSSEDKLSKESAFKYFVLGSFASAIMLYGISFIYGTAGSTYLPELKTAGATLISTNRLFLLGFVMLLVGMLFKIAAFPFQAWTPDVYQGSPTPVTGFMATGVKAATLAFFLRLMATQTLVAERAWPLVNVLQWLAALTIIVGNVGAFRQHSVKRMLAYSSIAHSGYIMIGLIAAGIGGENLVGASGVLFYIFSYALMTIGAFGVLSLLETNEDHDVSIDDLRGLSKTRPLVALAMTVLLLSLAGIPPTIGFFGKLFLFSAAVKQGFWWLALWGVIGSVISVYYYLRPVVAMYMQEAVTEQEIFERPMSQFVVVLMAVLVVGFGIFSEPFFQMFVQSVAPIF